MRSKIISGTPNTISTAAVNYAPIFKSQGAWNSAETVQFQVMPMNGILSNFRVVLSAAPGSGRSYTFVIRKNGADTAATITISGSDTTGTIRAPISVVTGDLLSISSTPSGSPATATAKWTLDFKGAVAKKSMLIANSTLLASTTVYAPVQAQGTGGVSAPINETLISANGTISNMIVVLSAPLTTGPRTLTLRKNGVNTGLTVTLNTGETTASDNVNSVSVAPGDRLVWVSSGLAVAVAGLFISAVFNAETEGESVLCCGSSNSPSTTVTNYSTVGGLAENSWSTSEATAQQVVNAVRLKRFEVRLSNAPGTGNSWTFNVRVNGAPVGLQVVISDSAITGSIDGDVSVAAGSLLSIESVPASGPNNASRTEWGLTTFQLNDGGRNQAIFVH